MDNYTTSDNQGEKLSTYEDSSDESSFMEGFMKDEDIVECAECDSAIASGEEIVEDVEGDKHPFCSKVCFEEFKESI